MKLMNTALGLILAKLGGSPFYVRFHVTHRCNYRCRMCGQHRTSSERTGELPLSAIRAVAERIARMRAYHIVITGGEPFLRPDLPDVIAAFRQHNLSIRVQTNGGPQVTSQMLAQCARAGLCDISVSLDTLNPSLQDEICQSRRVVDHALRTMQLGQQLLPHGISQANIVASAYNFAELPDLVRFFYHRGMYTYITPVMIERGHATGRSFRFRGQDASFKPEDMDADVCHRILDELIGLRRLGFGLTNSTRYLRDYKSYLTNGQSSWRCEAGILTLDILPDGSVCPCKEKPPIGNILDEGFPQYYRSPAYLQRVRKITSACQGCFYGEYREPQYALHDPSVLQEWVRGWFCTFRRGMRFNRAMKSERWTNTVACSPSAAHGDPKKG